MRMRQHIAIGMGFMGVLVAGCGSSSPKTLTTTIPPRPTSTALPTPTAGVSITDTSGFRWTVKAGRASLVAQYATGGLTGTTNIANPGQDYMTVPLTVTNLQTDRPANLLGVLAAVQGVGATVYLGVPTTQQPGDCATTQQGTLTAPAGFCLDPTDVVLPDGTDINDAENFHQAPQAQAGETVEVTVYAGPVPSTVKLQNLELLIEAGTAASPSLVSVPIG